MYEIARTNRRLLSSSESHPCDGPKLHAFQYRNDPIEWLERIDDRRSEPAESSCQGYVFKVKIRGGIYALKVFKFFDPNTYRWLLGPINGLKVPYYELGFQTNPFYAECRAYAQLQEARRKQGLKRTDFAECHGFVALTKKDATYLENDLCIDLWDPVLDPDYRREAEGSPVRAIVKTLVTTSSIDPDPRIDEKLLRNMLRGIRWINKQGVLIADMRMENYSGVDGVLVGFGIAWTQPHCRWNALPSYVKKDIHYIHLMDVVMFQQMIDEKGFDDRLRAFTNYEYKQKVRKCRKT